MGISLVNQTASNLSYLNGRVTVAPNGATSILSGLLPYVSIDPQILNDISQNIIQVNDGYNLYAGDPAKNLLQDTWLMGTPPQTSNDPIAFTLAGMGFSITADATLSSSTETPLLLLSNPISSLVNARAMFFYAAPEGAQGVVSIRVYTNPTVSNNGTALPIQNNLVMAGVPASSLNAYASPTVSSNGSKRITLVSVANGNTNLLNFAQTAILAPGNTMLITVSISNLGLLGSDLTHFYMQWAEA